MFSLDSSVGKWMAHQCHLANHCLSPSLTVSHNSLFLVCLPSHGKNNGFKTGWRRNNPRNNNPYINHHWQTQGPFFIIDLPSSLHRICSPTTCQNYCINVWQQIIFWPEKADLPLSQNNDSLIPCGLKATYSDTVGWNGVPIKLQLILFGGLNLISLCISWQRKVWLWSSMFWFLQSCKYQQSSIPDQDSAWNSSSSLLSERCSYAARIHPY